MKIIRLLIVVTVLLSIVSNVSAQTTWNPSKGMWLTRTELNSLPVSGTAWNNVVKYAKSSWGSAKLSDQDNQHDMYVLAGALYAARLNDTAMRAKVANAILSAIDTENGGRVLALARNLSGYVIAADLINLQDYSVSMNTAFTTWLSNVRNEQMTECDNLIKCHERRPNNWGTHAGAARIAADIYINDLTDLKKASDVFQGWLGDRSVYSGFKFGDLSWQCNKSAPVGINGICGDKSSVLPEEMRRGGSYHIPPSHTGYVWGGLSGAVIQAELLSRAGYPVYIASNSALFRAVDRLRTLDSQYGGWWSTGDDLATVWIVEHAYHAGFRTSVGIRPGKAIGFTDWTHNR